MSHGAAGGDPARRWSGTRLRPLTISHAQAAAPHRRGAVPRPPARQGGRRRRRAGWSSPPPTGPRCSRSASVTAPRSAWRSSTSRRRTPLGTGGAISNAAQALRGGPDSPVLVLNGDVLSGHDLAAQLDLHSKAGAAVTLHLVEVAGSGPLRLRAHRCRRAGDRVPGEDPAAGHQPGQRRLLRLPARVSSTRSRRAGWSRWNGRRSPADRLRCGSDGLRGQLVLARRGHARGIRPGLVRPGAGPARLAGAFPRRRRGAVLDGAEVAPEARSPAVRSSGPARWSGRGARVECSVLFDGCVVGRGARVRLGASAGARGSARAS